jgi:hypothetical protein
MKLIGRNREIEKLTRLVNSPNVANEYKTSTIQNELTMDALFGNG